MVLTRAKAIALALIALGSTTAGAQRGGMTSGFGARGSDGPRPLLFGFALECVDCRVTGRGARGGRGGEEAGGRGALGVWHYTDYPRVAAVMDGSAAYVAGIRAGDVLHSVDGLSLLTDEGAQHFSELRLGDPVHLTVDRNGKLVDVDLVLRRMAGRGGLARPEPVEPPSFTTRLDGVRVEVWGNARVVESTDSTGATILKIGGTVVRLAGDSPAGFGRGRGGRGVPPKN
jgi:membrane-associated protease RseP (regulator of RpoE activity)